MLKTYNSYLLLLGALIISISSIRYLLNKRNTLSQTYLELDYINNTDLNDLLVKHEVTVLYFYRKRCPYCDTFQPVVQKITYFCKEKSIFIAQVEKTNALEIAKKYSVTLYPSILIFKKRSLAKAFIGCSQTPSQTFIQEIGLIASKHD